MAIDRATLPKLWGVIPIHPDGEVSVWDFILQYKNAEDAQRHIYSNFLQIHINVFFGLIFARNSWRSLLLIYSNSKSLASWACFIQCFTGVVATLSNLSSNFPGGPRCRVNIWVTSFGLMTSSICISTCLLMRAYATQNRDKRILYGGILLIIPHFATIYIIWTQSIMLNSPHGSCLVHFPFYYPWLRFFLDVSLNIVFSIIFLKVVYRQYLTHGTACWRQLSSDGLIYLLSVVFANISCAFFTAFSLLGEYSDMSFVFDCRLFAKFLHTTNIIYRGDNINTTCETT
ncbi:hypothetical protein BDF19DRAFT_428635 [Syncephalis fuscata]|nr:hypothetical protein BDF19DRAFT_428635 [Syncephalis fuscata]